MGILLWGDVYFLEQENQRSMGREKMIDSTADDFWAWVSLGWALTLILALLVLWEIRQPPSPCDKVYFRESLIRCLWNQK